MELTSSWSYIAARSPKCDPRLRTGTTPQSQSLRATRWIRRQLVSGQYLDIRPFKSEGPQADSGICSAPRTKQRQKQGRQDKMTANGGPKQSGPRHKQRIESKKDKGRKERKGPHTMVIRCSPISRNSSSANCCCCCCSCSCCAASGMDWSCECTDDGISSWGPPAVT